MLFSNKTIKKNYTFTMSIGLLKSRDKKYLLTKNIKKEEYLKTFMFHAIIATET